MLDSLKDLEHNFYAIWGLYGCNQDNLRFQNKLDMNELLDKLDAQIKLMEEDQDDEDC